MSSLSRRWMCPLLGVWLVVGPANAQPTIDAPPAPPGQAYALLVGCTVYPNLRPRYQLRGPGNDVALMSALLRDKYQFSPESVVTLVHENDEAMRPTRANIVREFAALIDRVQAGDTVFILLGGHGSQLIDDDPGNPDDVELDGLDEVFLPEDVADWRPGRPAVDAIRDDQIRAWLDAIRDRGADVFFVADTCHSGTMDRAADDDDWDPNAFSRTRHVPTEELNDPAGLEALDAGRRSEADLADAQEAQADAVAGRGALVSLYAVDDRALEQEHPMPPENDRNGPSYGRLSYAMNWVLTRSRRPLSYRELAQQIRWRYEGWDWQDVGFILGTPQELDGEVLGAGRFDRRSSILLSRDEYGRLAINAGLLHRATEGTIYAVYPTTIEAEVSDQPSGYVRVVEATPTTARVEPCDYDGRAAVAAEQLPAPGRCELAFAAHGTMKMTVAVVPLDAEYQPDAADVAEIIAELAALPDSLIAIAAEGRAPDAYVLVDDRGIYLRKSYDPSLGLDSRSADAAAEFPPGSFGPFEIEDGVGTSLHRALESMAKAVNLRRLATSDTEMIIGDPLDPAVRLEVQVARWNADHEAFEDVDPLAPLEAYKGDKLRVRVFNRGGSPVDVTILYIESAFRIRSYFPTARQDLAGGFNNRLAPEQIPGQGEPAEVVFPINDRTIGLEDVIVIATLAEPGAPPQNFVFLEQPGLPVSRGDRDPTDPPDAVETPLGQLLASLAFGRGDRSGNAAADLARYAVHRVSWTVRKNERPSK